MTTTTNVKKEFRPVIYRTSVPVIFLKEGKRFVAYSPALDLSTGGKTMVQVKKRFAEAVEIFLSELGERGTLEQVLLDLGWRHRGSRGFEPPTIVGQESQRIAVALP